MQDAINGAKVVILHWRSKVPDSSFAVQLVKMQSKDNKYVYLQ
jgi:hypothetical protein